MLTVHHLRMSQSERIVWLCEEAGIEYELKCYERREDNRLAPDEYKALHPMGIAPVITDGDLALGESGAICEYIDAKYCESRFSPDVSSADYADHLFWLHFANGTMMATSMMEIALTMSGVENGADFVADRRDKAWELVEHRLGEAEFFGGANLTLADFMMIFSLTGMRAFGGDLPESLTKTRAYLKRIAERPAYLAAMKKAEPDRPLMTG